MSRGAGKERKTSRTKGGIEERAREGRGNHDLELENKLAFWLDRDEWEIWQEYSNLSPRR
jgi:hypothetical protein